MLVDWPLEQLRDYLPERDEPADFDAFWAADARRGTRGRRRRPGSSPYDCGLATVEVYDVTFTGFGGQPIQGWFLLPRQHRATGCPCVVEYVGYGGGRGLPHEWLTWAPPATRTW